jgi:hypothetical protein
MNLRNGVCLEGFRDRVSIYEDITGEMIGCDIRRVDEEFGGSIEKVSYDDPALIAAKNKCRDKFLAIAYIEHADKKRYSELQTSLSNDYLRKKADEFRRHWYTPPRSWTNGKSLSLEDVSLGTASCFWNKAKVMKEGALIEAVVDKVADAALAVTAVVGQTVNPLK